MSDIDMRNIDVNFRLSKETPGLIHYRGLAFGFVADDTKPNGERRLRAELTGTLTPAQFTSLATATLVARGRTALENLGSGPHVVTDSTGT